jgi:hypothetical protein
MPKLLLLEWNSISMIQTGRKVQWNQHTEDEATWETQDFLEKIFPRLLASCNL